MRKENTDLLGNVDVNYAKGKKAKIAIYRGDDARKCALSFSKIHGLSVDMTECLTEMLEKYINSFENSNEKSNSKINDNNNNSQRFSDRKNTNSSQENSPH
mmetsp:Transcript_7653/g.1070  ORF Transcript_7653/g.1070 Transcript_7653/m.1070 type:complete len:101 (-) Transcript_7653:161-463(-)